MSLRTDRPAFEAAYTRRSGETWALASDSAAARIRDWSPDVLILAVSPEFGPQIEALLDRVVHRDSLLAWPRAGPPAECLAGVYHGRPVSVFHTGITPGAFGASYMDMALERLRGGPARRAVVVGECSSLQEHVQVGNLVVAASAIRGDDSHRAYAAPDLPATADVPLSRALRRAARATGRTTHAGLCWSCGAGAGIYDPHLAGPALTYHRLGVLANTLEAATAYLLGPLVGVRVASLWLVADGVFVPLTWECPSPRLGWVEGWGDLVRAGLEALLSVPSEVGG